MTKQQEAVLNLLLTAKRMANYANICYTNDTISHETHYRYIEVTLLRAVRELEGHLTPVAADGAVCSICGINPVKVAGTMCDECNPF